ncbi:uncharacterized protein LOC143955479 [Lithobates pipiens]
MDTHEENDNVPHDQSGNLREDDLVKEEHIEGDEKDGGTTEFLEGHKDVAIEQPISNNPPERCSSPPLYSRDSTQEGHTIPHHHQSGNLRDSKVDAQEEFQMADEQYRAMKEFFEGNVDLYKDVMLGPHNTRNPPERCSSPPLYSRDSTQEDHTIPHHHQSGNLDVPTVDVNEQMKEKADEDGVEKVDKDLFQDTTVESSSHRDPPERPKHSTQEDHSYARLYQVDNKMIFGSYDLYTSMFPTMNVVEESRMLCS